VKGIDLIGIGGGGKLTNKGKNHFSSLKGTQKEERKKRSEFIKRGRGRKSSKIL